MTGSERMKLTASVLAGSAKLAKQALLVTSADDTVSESSLAYFAGHVAAILVAAERLERAVNRIDGWHNPASEEVVEAN